MTEKGVAPHAFKLCKSCHDYRLMEQGETKVSNTVWKGVIRQKTSRGKLRAAFGSDGVLPKMWERFATEKRWANQLSEEAAKAVQLETDSSWQHESPLKEELELLRLGSDLRLKGSLMRQAEEHRASRRTRKGSHCRTCAPIATDIRWKTTSGGSHQCMGRNSATGGVRHVAATTTGGFRTESWSYKVVAVVENQKFSVRTLRRKEYVTTSSTHSSSWRISIKMVTVLVKVLVESVQERSWLKMVEELRMLITMDNHEAVERFGEDTRIAPSSEAQVQYSRP